MQLPLDAQLRIGGIGSGRLLELQLEGVTLVLEEQCEGLGLSLSVLVALGLDEGSTEA